MNKLDLVRETEAVASGSWRHQDPRIEFKLEQGPRQQLEGTRSRICSGLNQSVTPVRNSKRIIAP